MSRHDIDEAAELVSGEWSPLSTPEDAKEVLANVDGLERAERQLQWVEEEARAAERSGETKRLQHATRAAELGVVGRKLKRSAEGHTHQAASVLDGRERERLSDDEYRSFRKAVDRALAENDASAKVAKLQRREERKAQARVVNEPGPYGRKSPNSWFVDRIAAPDPAAGAFYAAGRAPGADMSPQAVNLRLAQHAQDVRRALLKGGKYGRRVAATLREVRRQDDIGQHERLFRQDLAELKATEIRSGLLTAGGTTASASGGGAAAFVPPAFILDAWAPFRGIDRTFANQCLAWPLPEYGMEVYVPIFLTTDADAQQTELSGVVETDPTTALQGAQVQTVTGQVIITQQMHDRGFTGGGAFDQVMGKQLRQQLDEKLNLYVLNQVITGGATVAGASTWTNLGTLYADIAKGREQMTDTAGVRLRPTHFFSTSDFYSFASRQVDTAGRPVVTPQFAPGFPIVTGADDGLQSDQRKPKWARFTGTVLPGGVLWFSDDSIPAAAGNNQLIVSAPDEAVVVAESDQPILSVFPETYAPSLGVVVNLRSYVAAVTRHASGTAVISGAAYPTSLV